MDKTKASPKKSSSAKKKEALIHFSGKRKTAIARATVRPGSGNIRINSMSFDIWDTELDRLRIKEPVVIAEGFLDLTSVDIKITVSGGGKSGQVDAIRTAVSKALVDFAPSEKKEDFRNALVAYDRTLLAGDSRRTEPHKPSRSTKGPRAKRQKSYR